MPLTDIAADGAAASSLPDKTDLRRAVLALRDGVPADLRPVAAERIADLVVAALANRSSPQVVAGFWPIRSEIDPRPALERLAAHGHALALPVVLADRRTMIFRRWSPGDPLVDAAFGLREPPPTAPEVEPEALLMPLAAFDRRGGRLGYGGGFYDRALERLEHERPRLKIGLAFALQEVAHVPVEPHDRRLDLILTEAGAIRPDGDTP